MARTLSPEARLLSKLLRSKNGSNPGSEWSPLYRTTAVLADSLLELGDDLTALQPKEWRRRQNKSPQAQFLETFGGLLMHARLFSQPIRTYDEPLMTGNRADAAVQLALAYAYAEDICEWSSDFDFDYAEEDENTLPGQIVPFSVYGEDVLGVSTLLLDDAENEWVGGDYEEYKVASTFHWMLTEMETAHIGVRRGAWADDGAGGAVAERELVAALAQVKKAQAGFAQFLPKFSSLIHIAGELPHFGRVKRT